jgi:pyruvate/2-oxoglutarate dehydrogenase complex dihydrolipoamide dehydrogenase (E3) component
MKGMMPGREVVILGSGDIGLIMARRMTLEGAKVEAVLEIMPYSGGLARNIEQCLNDYGIPLYLSHTVTEIHGGDRVTGVTVSRVDENRRPIPGEDKYIECDTLLLSCGLIPENELTKGAGIALDPKTGGAMVDGGRQTSVPGIFACGNVLHVHDLVDYVSDEGRLAAEAAVKYIRGEGGEASGVTLVPGDGVRYTVPQKINSEEKTTVYFRVKDVYKDKAIVVKAGDRVLVSKKKIKLAPAEMESITLTEDVIRESVGQVITVEIEGV